MSSCITGWPRLLVLLVSHAYLYYTLILFCRGQKGRLGPKGQRGTDGTDGEEGLPGVDGLPGIPGNPGGAGERGPPGFPGDTGVLGEPGNVYAQLSSICQVKLGSFSFSLFYVCYVEKGKPLSRSIFVNFREPWTIGLWSTQGCRHTKLHRGLGRLKNTWV